MFNRSSFEHWRRERDGSGVDGDGTSGQGGRMSNAAIARQVELDRKFDQNGFYIGNGVHVCPAPQVVVSNRGRGRSIPPNPYARKAAPKALVSMLSWFYICLYGGEYMCLTLFALHGPS